jgi:hypothetical protein
MGKIYGNKVQKKNKKTVSKLVGNYEKKGKPVVRSLVERFD